MSDIDSIDRLIRLAVALAVGLTAGFERGWHDRDAPEGGRVAGWRTFGLIGLAGGLWRTLVGSDPIGLGLATLSLGAILAVAHRRRAAVVGDAGVTTLVAALVTFLLGALAGGGDLIAAGAGAVVAAILLSAKSTLHAWLRRLTERELRVTLQFLLISAVVLPLLPDRGYGPSDVLNPYRLWGMVVLIAGLSFAGYVAIKLWGERAGLMLTGMLGGIVSSTAIALDFAQRSRVAGSSDRLLAAGIVAASGVSFVRTAALVAMFQIDLLPTAAAPLAAMTAMAALAGWLLWRGSPADAGSQSHDLANPLRLRSAVQLGVVLAVVLSLFEWLKPRTGAMGLAGLSAVTGAFDVDATTLSLCRMFKEGMSARTTTALLLLGLASNAITKLVIVFAVGRVGVAARLAAGYLLAALGGAIAFMAL